MNWSALLDILVAFKEFLGNHPTLAFLTLSVVLNIYLLRALLREKDTKFDVVVEWLPVVDDMQKLVGYAARKARSKSLPVSKPKEGA